ncbi:glycosyltransferase family 2 protein [Algoriphagus sp.]|uniref:glycosyltransferase family 2 protein n=1 Tax=Algoriphagus sp. TaxID=1872435 RepID=UPI00271AFE07|nr:glycosyltransferase [Algoriphagus sp.]MDO8965076.1 glycosyltransferase [Algoriphagus sp.]MDP3199150.1 glycosyltransferase [Algoriphagus sp.]
MELSVIIPVKENDETIGKCLKAVFASYPCDFEVLVILDGWESEDFFSPWKGNTRLKIISVPKCGPAACRNYGVKMARGEWISFVDSDVLIYENTLSIALQRAKASSEDGLIGSYDRFPPAPGFVSKFRNLLHHHHHQKNHLQKSVFWGAFSLIRKRVFDEVGGFDENFEMPSIEDVELGIRIAKQGFIVRIQADIQVKHLKEWTFYNWMKTDIFLRAKPWTVLIFKTGKRAGNHLNTNNEEKISAILSLATWGLIFGGFFLNWLWFFVPLIAFSFILSQFSFYRFSKQNFSFLPLVVLLHQVYYIFAMIGFFLGCIDYTRQKCIPLMTTN